MDLATVEKNHRLQVIGRDTRVLSGRDAQGRLQDLDALYVGPRTRLNSDIAQQLGCGLREGRFGDVIQTDDTRQTSLPGVYAAGDIARDAHTVTWASADGVTAGMAVHRSLVF